VSRRKRIAILFGGRSAEHEVSVVSAGAVHRALDLERFAPIFIGITKEGTWHLLEQPPQLVDGARELPSVPADPGTRVELRRGTGAVTTPQGEEREIDVAFPLVHGPYGEDGTIQGLLELSGLPYVGAGVLASAVGMDKAVQKVLFAADGLPIMAHYVVHEREWEDDPEAVEARAQDLGYPLFAKPATLGSSIGITRVAHPDHLRQAVEAALRYSSKAVLERSAEGAREVECGVLGNDEPVASVPGEIVPAGDFYDYASKYLDGATRLIIPAELAPEVVDEIQRLAVQAFRAIDGAGMARIDFFVWDQGRVVVNEINTIPGFTPSSMYPRMWEASGVPYPRLIERLVELAIERHERERKRGVG
jgi:D-alanine-D-alanine ligase